MQTQTNYSRYASSAFDKLMRQSLTPERLAKCIEAYNWESGYAWGDDAALPHTLGHSLKVPPAPLSFDAKS